MEYSVDQKQRIESQRLIVTLAYSTVVRAWHLLGKIEQFIRRVAQMRLEARTLEEMEQSRRFEEQMLKAINLSVGLLEIYPMPCDCVFDIK